MCISWKYFSQTAVCSMSSSTLNYAENRMKSAMNSHPKNQKGLNGKIVTEYPVSHQTESSKGLLLWLQQHKHMGHGRWR